MVLAKQPLSIIESTLLGSAPSSPSQRIELIHAIRHSIPSLQSLLSFSLGWGYFDFTLVLETNDNFGFSESQGYREESTTGNIAENSRRNKTSSRLIKCKQYHKCQNQSLDQVFYWQNTPLLSAEPPGLENWFSSYAYESPILDTINHLIPSDHKESIVNKGECHNGKRKEVEKGESLSVRDDLTCNQTLEGQRLEWLDNGSTDDVKNSVDIDVNSFENAQISLLNPSLTNKCNGGNSRKEANDDSRQRSGGMKREDVGNDFVSIKSKREDDENSMHGRSMNLLKNQKRASSMKDESMRRNTLADVTNFEAGTTGKWKCPRRSKPDIGPPLKQLRLGQWFRYV